MTRVSLAAVAVLSLAVPRWTAQQSGGTVSLRGVSAVDDSVAWASGSGSTVLRTADGGATWKPLTVTTDKLDFRDVDAIDARTAYVLSIGNGPSSRIYKTIDAGEHWTWQYTNQDPKGFLDAMAFRDATSGVVVGDSVDGKFSILLTNDGGHSWLPATNLPAALPNEGAFAASGTNVTVSGKNDVWFGTGAAAKSRVLHSRDRGRTWTIADTPIKSGGSSGIFSIAFRDATHGIVVGGDYSKESEAVDNVAITNDGGATWTLIREHLKDHALSGFRSVVKHVPGTKASWIAIGPQGSDWSDDDGRTWAPIAGPGFHTFSFSKSGARGWGAGAKGAIGRFDLN